MKNVSYFHNGTIWMSDDVLPVHGWMAVEGNTLIDMAGGPLPEHFAGLNAIDLNHRHVTPGLVDCHTHLSISAWIPYTLDGSNWRSKHDVLQAINKQATIVSKDAWIIAFYADFFQIGKLPSLLELTEAAEGRPVLINDFSLHKSLISEPAMARANLNQMAFHPNDIERKRGGPTGLIKETAHGHTLSIALTEFAQQFESLNVLSMLEAEADRHIALGIVEAHDPCMHPKLQAAAEKLHERSPLRFSWSHVNTHEQADFVSDNVCLSCGAGPKSAKMFLDGADDCAICLNPADVMKMSAYSIGQSLTGNVDALRTLTKARLTYRNGKIETKFLRSSTKEVTQRIDKLGEQATRPKIHALGNKAISCACESLKNTGTKDATIEHLVMASDENIEEVIECGAVASLQPGFIQQAKEIAASNIEKALHVIPAKTLLKSGASVALSSDNPCGPLNPLHNIRRAVSRCSDDGLVIDAKEALTITEALKAYTIGGYHGIHGVPGDGLKPNAKANFVVLSGHPENAQTEVMQTWIAGECVYSRSRQPIH